MPHYIKRTFEEIKIGDYVYSDTMYELTYECMEVVEKFENNNIDYLRVRYDRLSETPSYSHMPTIHEMLDNDEQFSYETQYLEIDYEKEYKYSVVDSIACIEYATNLCIERSGNDGLDPNYHTPSYELTIGQSWSACEQMYGINHLDYKGKDQPIGSDPLRELAFAILKNDPIALDIARDILKI